MRVVSGMVVTELHGRQVQCPSDELSTFTSPPGQNCGEYMAPFFARGGAGYLVDNATSMCEYCAYTAGEQFYLPLGLEFSHRWTDLGIFAAFIASNLVLLLLGVCIRALLFFLISFFFLPLSFFLSVIPSTARKWMQTNTLSYQNLLTLLS